MEIRFLCGFRRLNISFDLSNSLEKGIVFTGKQIIKILLNILLKSSYLIFFILSIGSAITKYLCLKFISYITIK